MSDLKNVKSRLENFEKALRGIKEAQEWQKHGTAVGRNKAETNRLRVNFGRETFMYNIQYNECGQNYWNMPEDMRGALAEVVKKNSQFLFSEAEELLRQRALEKGRNARALVEEFEGILAEMNDSLAGESSGE